ncbi:MAG: GNAT family N-acetyltransferase [Acidobacteria bacterium]|nr:GNAT family N-acetyltransferase [Acidobacteriota bacterium]
MTATDFIVRGLEERDLNEWFQLRKQLWDATGDDDHQQEMLDIINHPETELILVAESDGRLIGFLEASIRPFVEDCLTDNVGYLEGWYVHPDHRRAGVGGELVRHAELWAREKGSTEMASDAEIGNERSLAAHLQLGYIETSRLVHLRKELD